MLVGAKTTTHKRISEEMSSSNVSTDEYSDAIAPAILNPDDVDSFGDRRSLMDSGGAAHVDHVQEEIARLETDFKVSDFLVTSHFPDVFHQHASILVGLGFYLSTICPLDGEDDEDSRQRAGNFKEWENRSKDIILKIRNSFKEKDRAPFVKGDKFERAVLAFGLWHAVARSDAGYNRTWRNDVYQELTVENAFHMQGAHVDGTSPFELLDENTEEARGNLKWLIDTGFVYSPDSNDLKRLHKNFDQICENKKIAELIQSYLAKLTSKFMTYMEDAKRQEENQKRIGNITHEAMKQFIAKEEVDEHHLNRWSKSWMAKKLPSFYRKSKRKQAASGVVVGAECEDGSEVGAEGEARSEVGAEGEARSEVGAAEVGPDLNGVGFVESDDNAICQPAKQQSQAEIAKLVALQVKQDKRARHKAKKKAKPNFYKQMAQQLKDILTACQQSTDPEIFGTVYMIIGPWQQHIPDDIMTEDDLKSIRSCWNVLNKGYMMLGDKKARTLDFQVPAQPMACTSKDVLDHITIIEGMYDQATFPKTQEEMASLCVRLRELANKKGQLEQEAEAAGRGEEDAGNEVGHQQDAIIDDQEDLGNFQEDIDELVEKKKKKKKKNDIVEKKKRRKKKNDSLSRSVSQPKGALSQSVSQLEPETSKKRRRNSQEESEETTAAEEDEEEEEELEEDEELVEKKKKKKKKKKKNKESTFLDLEAGCSK